ncbi:RCC1 domain-containing protein 1 [Pogona vitticeps]
MASPGARRGRRALLAPGLAPVLRGGKGGPGAMAAAGGGRGRPGRWFQFGFRLGAPTESGLEPAPLGEAGTVRGVRPSWSFVGILTDGSVQLLLRGATEEAALPKDCLDVLPSETHLLVLREAALEGWPVPGCSSSSSSSGALLEGEPAWRRELRPEDAAAAAASDGPRGHPPGLPLVPGGFAAPRPPFFTPLPATLQARQLALGHEHALLLSAGGALFSWGGGRHGQLGHGDLESRPEPQPVEALQGVPSVEVAAGGWHSAALGETGDLYLWGWNESGQLALPSKTLSEDQAATRTAEAGRGDSEQNLDQQEVVQDTHQATFISIQAFPALVEMPHGEEISKISCGSRHTAAVTCTGHLYTWGWGKYGQLGHQETASSDEPRRVCYFVDRNLCIVDVVCGPWTTYALAVDR